VRSFWAVIAAGLGLIAACSYPAEPAPFRPAIAEGESPQDGRTLFLRDCAWCHGSEGGGTSRAPELASGGEAAADFMLTTGRMPLEVPTDPLRRSETSYTREQIDAIVEYVGTLGDGPPTPEVQPEEGDLALGEELYSLNCAACHSTTGIGGALTSGQEAPSLHLATPTQTVEAMITGPAGMPVFGAETFDQREVDSIAAYVEYLQDPEERGGGDLGGLGPWSEGLVAWVVGFGACLLVIRLIGTKAGG
jgi:ubiquinol-cytochrome c reductase cytochrome c subunit